MNGTLILGLVIGFVIGAGFAAVVIGRMIVRAASERIDAILEEQKAEQVEEPTPQAPTDHLPPPRYGIRIPDKDKTDS